VRRKVLQHFANVLCQQFLDLGSGHDAATFVHLGSGRYVMDILSMECARDGMRIPSLKVCRQYHEWLCEQLAKHRVPPGLMSAELTVAVAVSNAKVQASYGREFGSADFHFDCRSEIKTDEKAYTCEMSGAHAWGFDPPG
jgi:hypothetical protein